MSAENIDIESAVEANKKLKEAISSLENDGEAIDHQIDDLIKQREALIKPFLPLDDFKKALVDFVGVSGKRYEETIRKAVSNFAMGGAFGSGSKHEFGKPLGYTELTNRLLKYCLVNAGAVLNSAVFHEAKGVFNLWHAFFWDIEAFFRHTAPSRRIAPSVRMRVRL